MTLFQWATILILSCVSGVLYRLGGIGKPFNTKYRDFGCPVCSVLSLLVLGIYAPWWVFILYFGASFGTMTTYWDYWGTDDVEWYEWALTGFMYAVPALLICVFWGHWIGFLVRCAALSVTTCLYSVIVRKASVEEFGRGFLFVISSVLLLIH